MKTNLKLFGSMLAICIAMIACDNKDQYIVDLKSANNGMIKSYNNAVVLKWDEALSLAVDNKMHLLPNPGSMLC
jgi:hypothetical protein